jgi:hypothetical protein
MSKGCNKCQDMDSPEYCGSGLATFAVAAGAAADEFVGVDVAGDVVVGLVVVLEEFGAAGFDPASDLNLPPSVTLCVNDASAGARIPHRVLVATP